MNIKDIPVSNNKKKQILTTINDHAVAFQDENGDVVVDSKAYLTFKEAKGTAPIEELLELPDLETLGDYIVFQ